MTETPARSTICCGFVSGRVAVVFRGAASAVAGNSKGKSNSSPPSMKRKDRRLPLHFAGIKRCVLIIRFYSLRSGLLVVYAVSSFISAGWHRAGVVTLPALPNCPALPGQRSCILVKRRQVCLLV